MEKKQETEEVSTMTSYILYGIVCIIGALCVAWWWRNMRKTAWLYTIYVGVILALAFMVVCAAS